MRRSSRNAFTFPDFSIRRLLLQGARAAARGSPPLARMCDIDRGGSGAPGLHAAGAGSKASNSGGGNGLAVDKHHPPGTSVGSSSNITGGSGSNAHGTPKNLYGDSVTLQAGSPGPEALSPTAQKQKMTSTPNECPLCYHTATADELYALLICKHVACRKCLESYLNIEITESRTDIACPQCSESMHPSDIQCLLQNHPTVMIKYEDFMVRRVLLSDPDSRWCPAPNCSYAVIASGCASCPRIRCERPGCFLSFCYHCKAEWHPDQTCDAARASRQSPTRAPSGSISQDSQHRDDIKPCPRCQVLIVKMNDGSCNHMVCAVCGSEFCWLCMKEISDLHYLSPSGCTFWGKKPWSRKKKLLWQLGTLVGAPVGIALVAGIAVPAMIIGIPVWVGRKIHTRYKMAGKHKRNCAVLSAVTASFLVAPVLAGFAVAIGVPILLFYVYGVVPVSLCRAGCGVSTRDGFKFDFDEEEYHQRGNQQDAASADAVSRIGATSIGEVSLSVASHLGHAPVSLQSGVSASGRESTTALAGSITGNRLEVQADISTSETASAISEKSAQASNDTASTRALAGSILSYKQHPADSEDGASVRFDKSVCYVIDGKKEAADVWFIAPVDQDQGAADKISLGSGRSMRSSERSFHPRDDVDTSSLSSMHKRMVLSQRMGAKVANRNMSMESTSGSVNFIQENVSLEIEETDATEATTVIVMDPAVEGSAVTGEHTAIVIDATEEAVEKAAAAVAATAPAKPVEARNLSKTAILRNIFFSQISSSSSSSSSATPP